MGTNISTYNQALLTSSNNIWENSSSACVATCSAPQNNPTIILNGTTVRGNVEIVAECNASAACAMQSQLDTQVSNIMQSMAQQSIVTTELIPISLMVAKQKTSNIVQQNITNNITQNMQSICQATTNTMLNNPTIVGTNATVGGNLTIVSDGGSANADCTINNLARMSLFNSNVAQAAQSNKRKNVLGVVMIAIVMMLVLGVIIVLVIMGPEGVAAVVGKGKGGAPGDSSDGELESLLGGGEGGGGGKGGLMKEAELAA